MGIYYVLLFLIFGTAIFLFFLSSSSKIKAKNLSLIMVCLGINLLISPVAFLQAGQLIMQVWWLIMELMLRAIRQQLLLQLVMYFIFQEDFSSFREYRSSYYFQLFGSLQEQRKKTSIKQITNYSYEDLNHYLQRKKNPVLDSFFFVNKFIMKLALLSMQHQHFLVIKQQHQLIRIIVMLQYFLLLMVL